jgi:hypothetical protein
MPTTYQYNVHLSIHSLSAAGVNDGTQAIVPLLNSVLLFLSHLNQTTNSIKRKCKQKKYFHILSELNLIICIQCSFVHMCTSTHLLCPVTAATKPFFMLHLINDLLIFLVSAYLPRGKKSTYELLVPKGMGSCLFLMLER